MQKQDFIIQQFVSLREEIKATKQRIFLIVFFGLIAVPLLTFLSVTKPHLDYVAPMLPFLVLVITVLFFAEQNALMRCGHFIRQQIEPKLAESDGWEFWLESRPNLRRMDKYFAGCFMIVFFVFYFLAVAIALNSQLWTSPVLGGKTDMGLWAGGVTYAIGAIWMIVTLAHHWQYCTTTRD